MRDFSFCAGVLLLLSQVYAQDVLKPLLVTAEREVEQGSGVDIERIGAERVSELLGHVPGLSVVATDSAGFGDTLAVRGTANTLFFGGAGVALVVDDVPFGDVYTYSTEFFDLESFVLHRGSQGSRFARNGPGGLIELKTLGPTDDPEYGFSAEYGSFDSLNLRFRASGPLSERWAYTFQSYYKRRNGFIENTNPAVGGFRDEREQFGALGSLYYTPSTDLKVRFRALYEGTRDGSQRLTGLPGVVSDFGAFVDSSRAQDFLEVNSDLEGETEIDRLQFSLHFDQDFGWGSLKSITSYQTWELSPNTVDLDLTAFPITTSSINQEQDVWSQEFRLESDESESLRWRAGLAYLRRDSEGDAERAFPFTVPNVGTFSAVQTTNFEIEEESVALFAHLEWDASERTTLELGGRLEYVENSVTRFQVDSGDFPSVSPTIRDQRNDFFFTPSLGLSYAVTDETVFFARTSTSFKPQGFTAFSNNAEQTRFDEEFAWETEVGVRYESADDELALELRAFYKRIDDYQLNTTVPNSTDFIVVNADRVTAFGVEAEFFWKPIDSFTLQATAGWNEVEFDDHTGLGGDDLSGNDVPFIPEFTASLTARYDFRGGYYLQAGVRAVGQTFFEEVNQSDFRQGSYELWDAQFGYEAESWNVAFFIRNAFDEEYFSFVNSQIAAGSPGDPQVVGVRLGLEF